MKARDIFILITAVALSACAAAPDAAPSMDGTRWSLVAASNPFGGLAANSGITIEFEADRIAGHGGCNRYGAPYSIAGELLTAGPTVATKRACPGDGDTIERVWFGLLAKPVRLSLGDDELSLISDEGLTFRFVRTTP
jgi:heat shock protein HslJ